MPLTLLDVLKFKCTDCGVRPFSYCRGPGTKGRAHRARWATAEGREIGDPRSISCPKCGAKPGEDCVGAYAPRRPGSRHHVSRISAFNVLTNKSNKQQS